MIGVSEGQYLNLLDTEVSDIKAVLKELNPRVTPKLTVIVATKRHHLRFFPERGDRNASDKNGNALPGTIVQTGCVSPFEWEFYLCAHSAIKVRSILPRVFPYSDTHLANRAPRVLWLIMCSWMRTASLLPIYSR